MSRPFLAFAVLLLATGSAAAAPTIVGRWVFPGGQCNRPMDTVEVRPMGIVDDGSVCEFRSVRREGLRVIWSDGHCSAPEEAWAETLIADDGPDGLTLRFRQSGAIIGPLQPCWRRR